MVELVQNIKLALEDLVSLTGLVCGHYTKKKS